MQTLAGLLRPVAVAAFHLGADAQDLRVALEAAMQGSAMRIAALIHQLGHCFQVRIGIHAVRGGQAEERTFAGHRAMFDTPDVPGRQPRDVRLFEKMVLAECPDGRTERTITREPLRDRLFTEPGIRRKQHIVHGQVDIRPWPMQKQSVWIQNEHGSLR